MFAAGSAAMTCEVVQCVALQCYSQPIVAALQLSVTILLVLNCKQLKRLAAMPHRHVRSKVAR